MFKFTFALCLLVGVQSQYPGSACSVDEEEGVCTALSKCKRIQAEIISAGLPTPRRILDKLRKLQCGFLLHEPLVCCTSSMASNFIPGKPPDNSRNSTSSVLDPYDPNVIDPDFDTRTGDDIDEDRTRDITNHPNLALLPRNCGNSETNRIYGGNRTSLYDMPWMVLLSYNEGRDSKLSCSGTLINEWYVLTAAHCVDYLGNTLRLESVVLGEYDVSRDPDCETVNSCAPPKRDVLIDQVIVHPGYRPQTLWDDIALIRLLEPANFSIDTMGAICLPITRELIDERMEGKIGTVSGWGLTELGIQSNVLLAVDLPIVPNQDCQTAYRGTPKIHDTQLCVGGIKDKDSCGGDSGGPLIAAGVFDETGARYIQRGIVSFGSSRCGLGGVPGVFTKVASYMDWILDNLRP